MLKVGAHRVIISPQPGVELAGWGYYIERRWQSIHDDLSATAIAVEGERNTASVVSVDLMVIDERFTASVRQQIAAATGVPGEAIMLAATHLQPAGDWVWANVTNSTKHGLRTLCRQRTCLCGGA